MICRRAWQGTDILMITDIPAGGHMQQKEKKFNGATSRFHKFPPPVTPSDSWRCQGQGSYHFISLLSVSPHLSFHPSPLPHPPCTSVAASEISLCASVEAAAGEFTSLSVSLKCIPSLGQLAVRRLDPSDLCRSTVRTCAHRCVCSYLHVAGD